MKNIYVQLFNLLEEKRPLVFGVIVDTVGSAPQVPGASALFSSEGLIEGTLGGGLLEFDAKKKALEALDKKSSLISEFSLREDVSAEEGAICGGEVRILIDASPEEHRDAFHNLSQSLEGRQPGVLATFINKLSDKSVSLLRYWVERGEEIQPDIELQHPLLQEEIKNALSEGDPKLLKIKEEQFPEKAEERLLFLEPIFPLPRLVIAGAGHIGQVVAHLGSLLNFEVTVIDDRPEFANEERLPDTDHIIVDEIGKAIQNFPVSPETYMVIVTRGHRCDADALRECITSEAAYIGMIGSRRKINLMREQFLEKGWATASQFDRVHAPIGIDIQSKTVEEIAISIAAQLAFVRSQIQDKRKDRK
ncbi:MAG: XdhC family protein [Candidatus Aminicenantes bacterium]|nr:MAG: XdhC family protein [Candidatus Aminicenantes bacterium]